MSSRTVIHLVVLVLAGLVFLLFPERQIQTAAAERPAAEDLGADAEVLQAGYANYSDAEPNDLDEGEDASQASDPRGDWPGIRGKVLDLRGEPVGGLTVRHRSVPSSPLDTLEETSNGVATETARDGSFELMVGDGSEGTLSIENESWVLLGEWRSHAGDWDTRALALVAPAISIAGRVTDEGSEALQTAEVRAIAVFPLPAPLREAAGTREWSFERHTTADLDGRFDLGALPCLEQTRIEARTEGRLPALLHLPPTSTSELRISLKGL
jgi:hypothetical protein